MTTKEYGEAEDCFTDAIENEKYNVRFRQNRAKCYNYQGKFSSALIDLEVAKKIDGTDP